VEYCINCGNIEYKLLVPNFPGSKLLMVEGVSNFLWREGPEILSLSGVGVFRRLGISLLTNPDLPILPVSILMVLHALGLECEKSTEFEFDSFSPGSKDYCNKNIEWNYESKDRLSLSFTHKIVKRLLGRTKPSSGPQVRHSWSGRLDLTHQERPVATQHSWAPVLTI